MRDTLAGADTTNGRSQRAGRSEREREGGRTQREETRIEVKTNIKGDRDRDGDRDGDRHKGQHDVADEKGTVQRLPKTTKASAQWHNTEMNHQKNEEQ